MKTSRTLVGLVFVCALPFAARAQLPGDTPGIPSLDLAILNAFPPPPDDPLLDSSGNVVMDSDGHPVSDPEERFHQAKPFEFDPAHLYLVQSEWLTGIGCPTSDPACPGDPDDHHNEGLLLVKTGPTANNTSAGAELKKVRGTIVTELGYDIRKTGTRASPLGSHCGAGAPRFNLIPRSGPIMFIGCNTVPPPTTDAPAALGWTRLRWTIPPTQVERIQIIFDEGQDTGPDFFGAAIIDNIDVNGQIVGRGPSDGR